MLIYVCMYYTAYTSKHLWLWDIGLDYPSYLIFIPGGTDEGVVTRTMFLDEHIMKMVDGGCKQIVILAAGHLYIYLYISYIYPDVRGGDTRSSAWGVWCPGEALGGGPWMYPRRA